MSSRRAPFYAYVFIAFGLAVFGVSMWALLQALTYYDQQQFPLFIQYALLASVGIGLSLTSVTQMRRRMLVLQSLAVRVLSTVVCASCGFKVVRSFSTGDYVMKEVGQCQQCKGTMRLDSIYAQEPQGKKT